MIDKSKPLLLVDLGFALFHRYYATINWYKFSHPEEKATFSVDGYKWYDNEEYMDKYEKKFFEDICTLAKKFSLPMTNVILAEDCRQKDIWRKDYYQDYKATRAEAHANNGFNGQDVFHHLVDTLIPKYIKRHNLKHIKHARAEADDVVACIVMGTKQAPIYILAKDSDYFQLLDNSKVIQIDMRGNKLNGKASPQKGYDLFSKIMRGDTSDNIPGCYFRKDLVSKLVTPHPKTPSTSTEYVKANKKIVDYYFTRQDDLETDIKDNPGYIKNDQYKLNRTLVDFRSIPEQMQKDIYKKFKVLIKKPGNPINVCSKEPGKEKI